MKAAPRMIGFLVLDEGKPVRSTPSGYVNFGRWPAAIFTARKDAERLRYSLRSKYFNQANEFNPNDDANTKRVFELWKTRAESVSVQRAQWHEPSGKELV